MTDSTLLRNPRVSTPRRFTRHWLALALLVAAPGAWPGASLSAQRAASRTDSTAAWLGDIELIYSASRYAQDAREAPVMATVITAREIREHGYRTLADVLGSVRGFSTRYDFNYDYANVGGLGRQGDYNTRLLLLVDGERINAAASDFAGIGTEALVDLEVVDRIEVIRGPGSALFGTNAFFGIVNIVTVGAGDRTGVRALVEGGSAGTGRGGLTWGREGAAGANLLISAFGQRRAGVDRHYAEFDAPSTDHGVASGLDGEDSYRLFAKGRAGDWSFHAAQSFRRRSVPTAAYGTNFNDPALETRDAVLTGAISFTHAFEDLSRLIASASYTRVRYAGDYPYDSSMTFDGDHGSTVSIAAQYLRVFGDGHKFTVGGEGRVASAHIDVSEVFSPTSALVYTDRSRSLDMQALFTQFEWRLGERAILYTGIRHDDYGASGESTNPRFALVLRPVEATTVKLLYGSAFRAPNIYELSYDDAGLTQKAPAALASERTTSLEVSAEQRLGGLTATLSVYSVRTRDLIDLTTDPSDSLLVFENIGSAHSIGTEVEVRGRLGPVMSRAAFTLLHATEADDSRPVDSPRRIARVGASVPFAGGRGSLGAEVRHLGERPTLTGAVAPSFTLVNVHLVLRSPSDRTEFFMGVKDLLDAAPYHVGGAEHTQSLLRQEGRSVRAGVRITLSR
jgi:outer membrane receptor for ferrienterochelin and colicins